MNDLLEAEPTDPSATSTTERADVEFPSVGEALTRTFLSLGIIVVLLVAVAIVVRRMRRSSPAGRGGQTLRVLETLDLDMRHRLYLVGSGGESILIGVAGDTIAVIARNRLADRDSASEPAAPPTAAGLRAAALTFDGRTSH